METFYQIAVILLILSNIVLWISLFGLANMFKISLKTIVEILEEMG